MCRISCAFGGTCSEVRQICVCMRWEWIGSGFRNGLLSMGITFG